MDTKEAEKPEITPVAPVADAPVKDDPDDDVWVQVKFGCSIIEPHATQGPIRYPEHYEFETTRKRAHSLDVNILRVTKRASEKAKSAKPAPVKARAAEGPGLNRLQTGDHNREG